MQLKPIKDLITRIKTPIITTTIIDNLTWVIPTCENSKKTFDILTWDVPTSEKRIKAFAILTCIVVILTGTDG